MSNTEQQGREKGNMRQIDRKRKKEKGGKRGKRDKKTEINRESILNTQSKR